MLGDSSNSFVDKLASIKYITKKDSKFLSSVVSGIKEEKITIFLLQKNNIPDANRYFYQLLMHLNHR